jgi:hypothetical protein
LPIGRFLKSKSLGGNRVILVVRQWNQPDDAWNISTHRWIDFPDRELIDLYRFTHNSMET